ncbi:2959_t:CDS:2 [Funneliformis geosporum]|nr:2959_t:CDS:2 [Funneliformis geosporum]
MTRYRRLSEINDESVEDGDENEEECSEDALYYEESQKIIENNVLALEVGYFRRDDRDLETLPENTDVWMSKVECKRIHNHLHEAIRKEIIIDLTDLSPITFRHSLYKYTFRSHHKSPTQGTPKQFIEKVF